MRQVNRFVLIIGVVLLASCAATSYGVDPKAVPTSADTYDFTVYFNAFTTDAHIERDCRGANRELQAEAWLQVS